MNSNYEEVKSLQHPYINNPHFIYGKSYFITLTNYLIYKYGSNYLGLGLSILALDRRKIYYYSTSFYNYNPLNKHYFAYLLRYERNVKTINNSTIHLLMEIESANKKRNYFQLKIGLSYNIN